MTVGLAGSLIFAVSLVANHFRMSAIDPRVTVELGEAANVKQASARQPVIATTIDGEVARTAERVGEATALALSASLYAASEQLRGCAPRGAGALLSGLAARNLLPPGLALTHIEGGLVSTYGDVWMRYRPEPLGVEVISIGHKPSDGPALRGRRSSHPASLLHLRFGRSPIYYKLVSRRAFISSSEWASPCSSAWPKPRPS